MAYAYKNTYTRPSTSIPFFEYTNEFNQHVQTAYKDTNKIIYASIVDSPDGLVQVRTTYFGTEADWIDFCSDPEIFPMFQERQAYHESVGITMKREIIV